MLLMRDHALNDDASGNGGNRVSAGNVPVSDVVHGPAEQPAVSVEGRIQGVDYLRDVEQRRLKKSHFPALSQSGCYSSWRACTSCAAVATSAPDVL